MSDVTFVFEHGKTYAIHEGKVIAADADPAVVQAKVKQGFGQQDQFDPDAGSAGAYVPDDPQGRIPYEPIGDGRCPGCGAPVTESGHNFCPECGSPLGHGDIHGGQGMEAPYPHDEPSPGLEMGGEAGPYMANVKQADGQRLPPAYDTGGRMDRMIPTGIDPMDVCPQCGSEEGPGPDGRCLTCGFFDEAGSSLPLGVEQAPPVGHPAYAKTVTTPNGLKGVVLGKVAGLWGEEVTVRLENGRIVKLPVGTALLDRKVAATSAPSDIDRLESKLNQRFAHTRADITDRLSVLQTIQSQAGELIRNGAPYAESVKLDQLSVQASVEAQECHEVLAAMEAAIPMAPPAFSMQAAKEAAGISREDASWLDHTLDEMVKQAEATDFTKLMDEGPEALTAELSDAALADQEVTREAASSFIAEKTAGITRKIAEPYMATFLTRVEECRRQELTGRQPTTHKQAAAAEDQYKDLPDDALFL